jgi:PKHD-type hydroxylase
MNWELYSSKLVNKNNQYPDYVTIKSVFNEEECDFIKNLNENLERHESKVNWGAKNNHKRDTDLFWLNGNESSFWIFDRIIDLLANVNQNHFRYELDGKIRAFQLGRYRNNQGYEWHQDLGSNNESRRKLTISIQLSKSSDYDGGELQFFRSENEPAICTKEIGSVTIFPSWMLHRVTQITKGERWSLANWIEGPPFK